MITETKEGEGQRRDIALLAVYSSMHLRELSRLAEHLRRESTYEPVFLLAHPALATEAARQDFKRHGIRWEVFGQLPRRLSRTLARGPLLLLAVLVLPVVFLVSVSLAVLPWCCRLGQALSGRRRPGAASLFRRLSPAHVRARISSFNLITLKKTLHAYVTNFLRKVLACYDSQRHFRHARHVLQSVSPSILVMAEDNVSFTTGVLVKVGHELGIPSVIVPYTLASIKEFVEGFRDVPSHSTSNPLNRWVARKYPHWCYEEGGHRFLRLPGHQVLLQEYYQIAPANPWIPNDGHWDAFAVESPRMMERYRDEFRLPSEKLVLTGALTDDALYHTKQNAVALRETLYRELGMPFHLPLVLLALPPDQFSAGRPNLEFPCYDRLVDFLGESMRTLPECNAIVSLHPRTDDKVKRRLEALGIKVGRRDTVELVPLCDVYVASVSATIRWAIVCGIPVVNYDVYHYGYDDYDAAKGVLTVNTAADYLHTLGRLVSDGHYRGQIRALQAAVAASWGTTDGKAGQRMVALLDRLLQGQRSLARSDNRSSLAAVPLRERAA
jgi:hypothetical protein